MTPTEQASLEDFCTRNSESESETTEGTDDGEELLERLEKIDRRVGVLYSLYGDLHADLEDVNEVHGRDAGEVTHTTDDTNTSPMFY